MKSTIEMAREAGFDITIDPTEMRCFVEAWEDQLKAFEALVRADERDACAKLIETHVPTTTPTWVSYAAAIRARK